MIFFVFFPVEFVCVATIFWPSGGPPSFILALLPSRGQLNICWNPPS